MTPFHQPYPWVYRNAELMIVDIACDADELDGLLPNGLTVRRPAKAAAWTFCPTAIAGAGSYQEFILNVVATDTTGATTMTTPYIYVSNDAAMASGREVLGTPKRIATVDQRFHNDQLVARVHRSGVDIVTLGMTLDREGDAADAAGYAAAFSRPTTSVINGVLMSSEIETTVHRVVHGRGFIDSRPSAADPIYRLAPRATGHAALLTVDMVLKQPVAVEGSTQGGPA